MPPKKSRSPPGRDPNARTSPSTFPPELPSGAQAVPSQRATNLMVAPLMPEVGAEDTNLDALRTAIFTAAALLLAVGSRAPGARELGWLVYPALLIGGGRLLLVDVPGGRAAALFPLFVLYGIALIVAPKVLRRSSSIAPPPMSVD